MAIFDRFKRNRNDSTLPEDTDAYYKEDRASRRTAALLLGLATFVTTLLVGSALYFGGRAVYRAVSGNDGQDDTAQVQEGDQPEADTSKKQPADSKSNSGSPENDDSSSDDNSTPPEATLGDDATATPALGDQQPLPATGDPGM